MPQKVANPLRVLVVDDEVSIADSLTEILRLRGHQAHAAYSGKSALECLSSSWPQVLIADVFMEGMNGVELANHVSDRIPACRIILFSGQADMIHTIAGYDLQSHRYTLHSKPIHPEALLKLIEGEGVGREGHALQADQRHGLRHQGDARDPLPGLDASGRRAKSSE
jgi:DNA-binding NtrC family response regulator